MTFPNEYRCDVCGNEVTKEQFAGVAASTLGPMSFGFCHECLKQNAEPLWAIHATLDLCEGPTHVADWVKGMRSYKDGKYLDWNEIVACYVPSPVPDPQCGDTDDGGIR